MCDGVVAWDIGAYEFNSFKPPRFIGAPQNTPEGWRLNITGEPNKWTRVQRSGSLSDWGEIWSGFMPSDGIKQNIDGETNQMMYQLHASTDFVTWTVLTNFVPGTVLTNCTGSGSCTPIEYVDPEAPDPGAARFYRMIGR